MLVADDGRALLTNFSCSAISPNRAPIDVGSARWRAPEHIDDSRGVTVEGDIWAFGMTVLVRCLLYFRSIFFTKLVARSYFLKRDLLKGFPMR